MEINLKPNAVLVYSYVKKHQNENVTAADIADALGLNPRSVNGIITGAFTNRKDAEKNPAPLMERIEGEPTRNENGRAIVPKYIYLTELGENVTINQVGE